MKSDYFKIHRLELMEDIVISECDVPAAEFENEPSECTVNELKRWLKCHGPHFFVISLSSILPSYKCEINIAALLPLKSVFQRARG